MSILDDSIRVHPTLYVAIEAMMTGEPPVATIADSKHNGGMFWMAHRFIPDETLGRDEIRRGEDVPEWHVKRLQEAMAEYAQRVLREREGGAEKFRPEWFKTCSDETHPRGPHVHVPSGAVQVTDERIANAANTLAFPETDAGQERAVRGVKPCNFLHAELSDVDGHLVLRLRMDDVALARLEQEVRCAGRLDKPKGAGVCIPLVVDGFVDGRTPASKNPHP